MSDLKQAGLLNRRRGHAVAVVESVGTKILLSARPGATRVVASCIVGNELIESNIDIVWQDRKFGARPLFFCPETGRDCLEMYFDGARFVHRSSSTLPLKTRHKTQQYRRNSKLGKAFSRITGRDGRSPARGRNRIRLLEMLEREPGAAVLFPELGSIFKRERKRRIQADRRSARAKLGLAAKSAAAEWWPCRRVEDSPAWRERDAWRPPRSGLLEGYPFLDRNAFGGVAGWDRRATPDQEWLKTVPPITYARPKCVGRMSDHAALEIAPLARAAKGHAVGPVTTEVEWWLEGRAVRFSLLVPLKPRVAEWIYIRRDFDDERPPQRQILRTTRTATGRQLFLCPVTGTRCERLYYRDGYFASARAQRLTQPSQRK